ncbi:response regulator [Sedimenticola thiotaurini]|uniref:Transcriptional regulator n=1 Tax=Sedimenticola thiotaurini TaxID=1543721 RepID=A0A0F7K095_9GAMM|nr:response regulator [Sedimenticola thiotaurini]AKH20383.1 transcriptional regulator [Sedimenticola thiotaurini]
MNGTILVVEDEEKLARLLTSYLKQSGYAVQCLYEGDGVSAWIRQHQPDLVLLDLMLPGTDGLDICRDVRTFSTVPIIMVTARVEEIDRLLGLELGADDYICKPYSPREVVARVRAVLRRVNQSVLSGDGPLLELHEEQLRVVAGNKSLELTAVEFHLLQTLIQSVGRIYSRDQLMDRIYVDRRIVSERTIDSHIKKLRRKLAALLPGQEVIQSVYGVGYKYDPNG